MTRRGAWEPLAAVVAMLVLGGVAAWYALEELMPPKAPIPGFNGPPFHALAAKKPEIGKFEDFYINAENPFVPWRVREVQAKREEQPKTVMIKPRQPVPIKPIEPPKLVLPSKKAGGGDAPKVFGFQGKSDAIIAIVQLPGETTSRNMRPGDKAGRWTFVGIDAGSVANFTDETGRAYAVVIGGNGK